MKFFAFVLVFAVLASSLVLLGCTANAGDQSLEVKKVEPKMEAMEVKNESKVVGIAVKNGDKVAVDYLGFLSDGKVFDTSIEAEAKKAKMPARPSYEPLEFVAGAGQMIRGFDAAVIGMKVGEEKTVKMPAKDAYGEWNPDLVQQVPLEILKKNQIDAQVGVMLYTSNGMPGKIIDVKNGNATIDFNHELAGKELNFKIIMRKIN